MRKHKQIIPAFTLHKEMKTPQIFKLPEIKNTLSETNPAFNNSMPLVKQYELRKKFSYLDPVFTGYFNQQQYRLFNSRYFGYELYGSSYSLRGVGTQNMAGGRLVYRLNRQLAIRIGGNAYQYRSNGRMFNGQKLQCCYPAMEKYLQDRPNHTIKITNPI